MTDPTYREAYQRLDIFEAGLSNPKPGWELNRRVCRFRLDDNWLAGELMVLLRSQSAIVIDYWLETPEQRFVQDRAHLPLIDRPNGVDPQRQYFECAGCGRAQASLVFRDETWLCGDCHQLGYRSKLIDPQLRVQERLAELDELLPGGVRPKGMHDATYRRLVQHRQELQRLAGWPRAVSAAHWRVVRAQWVDVADLSEIMHPGYRKEGDIYVVAEPLAEPAQSRPGAAPPAPSAPRPTGGGMVDINAGLTGESHWYR